MQITGIKDIERILFKKLREGRLSYIHRKLSFIDERDERDMFMITKKIKLGLVILSLNYKNVRYQSKGPNSREFLVSRNSIRLWSKIY